jgi:hypothetical protein
MTSFQCRHCGYGPLAPAHETCPRCCRRPESLSGDCPPTVSRIATVNIVMIGSLVAAAAAMLTLVHAFW